MVHSIEKPRRRKSIAVTVSTMGMKFKEDQVLPAWAVALPCQQVIRRTMELVPVAASPASSDLRLIIKSKREDSATIENTVRV